METVTRERRDDLIAGFGREALHLEQRALVGELRADYPGWAISLTECHGGWRLIAYREGCPSGLYALITDDVAELRQELDNAAMARAAS